MGTYLKVLSESFSMSTNMTGLDGFRKSLRPCVWTKLVSALEGLRNIRHGSMVTSYGYPVDVSSKFIHPSQSCDVKFNPLIISLQRNVKPMVKTGFSFLLARSQSRMLKIAWSVCSLAFEIYLVLEWNDRGVKVCLTALTWMIGFAWNCNKISLRYPSI